MRATGIDYRIPVLLFLTTKDCRHKNKLNLETSGLDIEKFKNNLVANTL